MNLRPSESGFVYLASPYTHPDPAVREERFQAVCRAAAALMREGHFVFSPIAHSHPIDLCMAAPQPGDFWKAQDVPILRHASRLVVLTLPGWEESRGLKWEMEIARQIHMPVSFMEPDSIEHLMRNYSYSRLDAVGHNGCKATIEESAVHDTSDIPAFLRKQAD